MKNKQHTFLITTKILNQPLEQDIKKPPHEAVF